MRDLRNPFRMRASEQITSETIFLRLFGPGVLDILADRAPLESNLIFRSAPGGGKTSLLRVFSAASLLTLFENRGLLDFQDLYRGMKGLGAIDDSGPQLLGIIVPCSKNYAALEDLAWDATRRQRLFCALLNCRIVLSALRGAMILKGLNYPSNLSSLSFRLDPDISEQAALPAEPSGSDAYEWAKDVEYQISQSLDSLDPSPPTGMGHSRLISLDIIKPGALQFEGENLVPSVLVMFDDVNRLAPRQRTILGEWLTGERPPVPAWLAERLEALRPDELLDQGARHGRDFQQPAPTLERYWRDRPAKFQKAISVIADKRAREARSVEIASLEDCLDASLSDSDTHDLASSVKQRVLQSYKDDAHFAEWIGDTLAQTPGSTYEDAVGWRLLEIQIARFLGKPQRSFDLPLPSQQLRADDSAVRASAELFLAAEFKLPYYFGFNKLASLASSNIEQFLALAADLFEEASAASILGRSPKLSARRQHAIIKRAAKTWWEEYLLAAMPMKSAVRALIESIGRFAQAETYRPNAPYAPGVTGISITMQERELLMNEQSLASRPDLQGLASAISTCIAHNVLEVELDRSQNYERRMLLYLNRLLCAHFDLPVQYGGWRPKRPDDLAKWMTDGFRPLRGQSSFVLQ